MKLSKIPENELKDLLGMCPDEHKTEVAALVMKFQQMLNQAEADSYQSGFSDGYEKGKLEPNS